MLGTSFCDATGWRIVWRDEFEGALNMSRWNVEHGVHSSAGSSADCHGADCHLLGSCRDAACSKDEVNVEGGRLVLSSHRRHMLGRNYTTGAVNTWGKVAWRASAAEGPFRLCTSAILPGVPGRAAGVWPAHWMMPHDDSCDPDEGEMDVMEMVNGNGISYSTYHWQDEFPARNCSYPANHSHVFASSVLPSGWDSAFHEWAVERGTDHIAFALDGTVVLNASRHDEPPGQPLLWDVPWYLIINTAIGGGWPGPAGSSTAFPLSHEIDYVRVARPASRTA
mmetsp:Transcript_16635/g.37284  ORF Transcript_16635/g.37284 Transcript_16635/m.37284 type:complete len:280 (-) Transcript_16635:95-934(-)